MAEIDLECEKAMIQFIFHHRAIRLADLDTVWKAFLRVYPFCEEIEVSDIKLHFLCMDMSSNVWDLDEEVFLYAKYAADLDEDEQEPENLTPTTESSPSMLVTFDQTQSYNTGPSWEAYQVFKDAFGS